MTKIEKFENNGSPVVSTDDVFDLIIASHKEKRIISLCNSLHKRCSFNRGQDIQTLCELAYWLYVAGDEEAVLMIAEYTHDAPFPGKAIYNVWDYILYIWGLEVYLYIKHDDRDKAEYRIKKIDGILKAPLPKAYSSYDRQLFVEEKRRERFTYPDVLQLNKIQMCDTKAWKRDYQISALYTMIGYTYTGLFPNLSAHKNEIEHYIQKYVNELKSYL